MYNQALSFLIRSARAGRQKELRAHFEGVVTEVQKDRRAAENSPPKPSRCARLLDDTILECEERFNAPTGSASFWLIVAPAVPTVYLLLVAASAERLPTRTLGESSPGFSVAALVLGCLVGVVALGVVATAVVSIYWTLGVRPGVLRESYSIKEYAAMCEQGSAERVTRLPEAVRMAPWFATVLSNPDRVTIVSYSGRRTEIEFCTLCYMMPNGESATIAVWYESPTYSICETGFMAS